MFVDYWGGPGVNYHGNKDLLEYRVGDIAMENLSNKTGRPNFTMKEIPNETGTVLPARERFAAIGSAAVTLTYWQLAVVLTNY